MREIIGENLSSFFENSQIDATKTFSGRIGYWHNFEVWEMTDGSYDLMCNMTDDEFEFYIDNDNVWWRGADGSNMGLPTVYFKVNGYDILAWAGGIRDDLYSDFFSLDEDEQQEYSGPDDYVSTIMPYEYQHVCHYFCEEIGVSTAKNVCALAVDLAKHNNMTMAELFRKYGGSFGDN